MDVIRDGFQPQNLDVGFEDDLVGKEQREREDLIGIVENVHRNANTPATNID